MELHWVRLLSEQCLPFTGVAHIIYLIYLSFIFMFLISSFFVLLHQSFNIF